MKQKRSKFDGPVAVVFPSDNETSILNKVFAGKTDLEITFLYVSEQYAGPISEIPGMMTDAAFVHFLPKFMDWSSSHQGKVDSLCESILMRFYYDSQRDNAIKGLMSANGRQQAKAYIEDQFDRHSYPIEVDRVLEYLNS